MIQRTLIALLAIVLGLGTPNALAGYSSGGSGGGAGTGDIEAVGDCSTGACFASGTEDQFLGYGSSGAATIRAIPSSAIPNNAADTSGNAATCTALAANGANCTAGNYPLGVDQNGAAESCTAALATAGTGAIQVESSGVLAAYGGSDCGGTPGDGQFVEAVDVDGTVTCNSITSVTGTLTNKTLDAEASGNNITLPSRLGIIAAVCVGATPGSGMDLPSSGAPTATCVEGTNTRKAYLDFADSGTQSAYYHFQLPGDWVGAVDVNGKWLTSATTGNVVWQIASACVSDAETNDPAWNTADAITDAAKGTTLQMNDFTATGLTMTGCAAGDTWHVKFFRDPTHASDTIAATASLDTLLFTVRRTM